MEEVTPNGWSPCELGAAIQLTKSVSLLVAKEELASDPQSDSETEGDASGFDVSKIIQIVLIVVCFLAAVMILLADKDEVVGEIDSQFDFNQSVSELAIKDDDIEYVAVRRYLQQAWMADRRFRNTRPQMVMYCYELLINHRLVRENPDSNQTLTEIAEYGKRRLSSLRFNE